MQKTNSLDPTKIELEPYKLIVADVDFSLIDFGRGHNKGIENIKSVLTPEIGEEVRTIFKIILKSARREFDQMSKLEVDLYNETVRNMEILQPKKEKWGLITWSREAFIILAAQKFGYKIDRMEVKEARNAYWEGVKNNSPLMPDAVGFIKYIREHEIPLILMTGSDNVMRITDDLKLVYDFQFSKQYKEKRLKSAHLHQADSVIGDPYDKPHEKFFADVFRHVEFFGDIAKNQVLFVGDSPSTDLAIPSFMGYPTLHIVREHNY